MRKPKKIRQKVEFVEDPRGRAEIARDEAMIEAVERGEVFDQAALEKQRRQMRALWREKEDARQELAERAGMSRSAFALRFKEKAGISAMEYLTHWWMLLAADRLVNSRDSVLTIAVSRGYESESAFGFAFKRGMGCSPRQYCRVCVLNSEELVKPRHLSMGAAHSYRSENSGSFVKTVTASDLLPVKTV